MKLIDLLGVAVLASSSPAVTVLGFLGLGAFVAWIVAVDREERAAKRAAATIERSIRAGGQLRDRLGYLVLYDAPPRFGIVDDGALRTWPITREVSATVEGTGSVSVTRGRNLAAKAIGGAIVPGGLFFIGNAKDTVHDHRELYLILEGPDWAYSEQLQPSLGAAARQFALTIGVMARTADTTTAADDAEEQLRLLTQLLESGVLTQDEFDAKKAEILTRPGLPK